MEFKIPSLKMSKKHKQALAWSMVAIAASLVAVFSSLMVVWGDTPKNDPADILPAGETLALAHQADKEVIGQLAAYVSAFEGIPMPGYPVDVALLKLPNGNTAWVILDATTAPSGMRFSITASDITAQGLIGKEGARLSDDGIYRNLRSYLPDGSSGAYLKFPGITLNPQAAGAALLSPSTPVAVVLEASRTRIVLPSSGMQSLNWAMNQIPAAFDSPSLALAADDVGILSDLSEMFAPSVRSLFQSTIRTHVGGLFGERVSPAFDLLPLVGSSFSFQANGSKVIVAGQADNAQKARAMITTLHEAFAANLPGVEVVSRPLDDQFSYTGIRRTDDTAQRTTEHVGGYDVEKSMRKSGSGMFVTAIRGTSVLLSNDETAMKKAVSSPFVSVSDGSVASLNANRASLDALLKTLMPSSTPLPGNGNATLQWSVKQEGGSLVLDIPR